MHYFIQICLDRFIPLWGMTNVLASYLHLWYFAIKDITNVLETCFPFIFSWRKTEWEKQNVQRTRNRIDSYVEVSRTKWENAQSRLTRRSARQSTAQTIRDRAGGREMEKETETETERTGEVMWEHGRLPTKQPQAFSLTNCRTLQQRFS